MSDLNQEERMLKMLRKAKSHGIENYTFAGARLLRYGATLKRLRDDGHNILTERQYLPNGRATGVFIYTLIEPKKNPWTKNLFHKVEVKEIE